MYQQPNKCQCRKAFPLDLGKFTTILDHNDHKYDDEEKEEDHTKDDNDSNVTFTLKRRYLERRIRSASKEGGNNVRPQGCVSRGGKRTEDPSLRR